MAGACRSESIRYVSLQGAHTAPYASWADAATNLQDALNVSLPGDTVLVADGVYAGPEAIIQTPVCLRSVNGPESTILNGGGHRAISILTNATVEGFTITGGSARNGGGVLMSDGLLLGCHVVSNTASLKGGGIHCLYRGRVENCRISGNCLIGNDGGGGVCCEYGGEIVRCTITFNKASQRGGGVYCDRGQPSVRNCVITDNTARYGGGIMFFTTAGAQYQAGYAESCLIARNTAEMRGGGGYGNLAGDFYNCTIVDNTASNAGGGVFFMADAWSFGLCANSIIYDNNAPSGMNHYNAGAYFFSCCTVPSASATCLSDAPEFLDRLQGDYRLSSHSPCINAGDAAWADLAGLDLDGRARLSDEGLEIGAYEYAVSQPEEIDSDSDGDGMSDEDELRAGTNPAQADSVFIIQSVETLSAGGMQTASTEEDQKAMVVRWASAEGRLYTVWRSTHLLEGFVAIQSRIAATPPENVYLDRLDDRSASFYRITVE